MLSMRGKGKKMEITQVHHNSAYLSTNQICVDLDHESVGKKVHKAVEVEVKGLTYRVPQQRVTWWGHWMAAHSLLPTSCLADTRVVLNDVSFTVPSGQMLAILGSSGSGKTSLLDVIACRNISGEVTGDVMLNGVSRTSEMLRNCAAYVRQDDRLMPSLTVRETLLFVAQLKLPRSFNSEEIKSRVDSVIAELGLLDAADTRIGSAEIRGISGGERRRVSIGIQMLIDPSLLFLDEPTSGLDSFTASHLVSTLSQLARNCRTILMSIHQPRSNIFELFDLVLLLSGGHVVYFGEAVHMVDYFTRLGFPCPELTNPCDHYIDLTTVDPTSEETEEATAETVNYLQRVSHQDMTETYDLTSGKQRTKKSRNDTDVFESAVVPDIYPGVWRQFSVLFRRWMRSTLEDWALLISRSVQSVAMSIMLGIVFWQMQPTQRSLRDYFGVLYMVSVMYPYLIIIDIIETCHKERKLFYFETQDHLYSTEAYYFAKIASDLLFHAYYIVLYVIPFYFMTNLSMDVAIFFQLFVVVFLSVLCSRGLAMMSAAIMPSFQTSCYLSQALFSFFIMSAGFFINLDNILKEFQWVSVISYLRWCFEGLCLVIIKHLNFTCDDEAIPGTCVRDGGAALQLYAFGDGALWQALTALVSSLLAFLGCMYIALRLIPQQPEEHN